MILYSDTELRTGVPSRVDPTKAYLRHYENYMYLNFLAKKRQADQAELLRGIQAIKRRWTVKT